MIKFVRLTSMRERIYLARIKIVSPNHSWKKGVKPKKCDISNWE